tara:strand:- start:74 stop:1033 length:960 start_codon:yes stop_codon:yes gene_type:complete
MEFSFSQSENETQLGLKERQSFDKVVSITNCLLQDSISNEIVTFTTQFFNKTTLKAWDTRVHEGVLRFLVIRHAKHQNKFMINLVVSTLTDEMYSYKDALIAQFPQISSIFFSVNKTHSETAFTEDSHFIYGDETIEETIGRTRFTISPYSFFQPNSLAVKTLYDCIIKSAQFTKKSNLLDLYCGTGSIGIYSAPYVNSVIGIEENPSAIKNAEKNKVLNQANNCTFIEGRVKNILKFKSFSASHIIVDPPRSGMVPKALKRMCNVQAPSIIYVSCNPTTFLRDAETILKSGYTLTSIQPIDMFPNTYHIELVSVFKKR